MTAFLTVLLLLIVVGGTAALIYLGVEAVLFIVTGHSLLWTHNPGMVA